MNFFSRNSTRFGVWVTHVNGTCTDTIFWVPAPWGLGEGSTIKFLNMVMWHIKLKGMSSRPGYTEKFNLQSNWWPWDGVKGSITIRFLRERGDLRWCVIECVLVFFCVFLQEWYIGMKNVISSICMHLNILILIKTAKKSYPRTLCMLQRSPESDLKRAFSLLTEHFFY